MKNLAILVCVCLIALVFGCAKEVEAPNDSLQVDYELRRGEYGPVSCECPDGECGAMCAMSNGGCTGPSACQCRGGISGDLTNFQRELEVRKQSGSPTGRVGAPIVDEALIEAMRADGHPVR